MINKSNKVLNDENPYQKFLFGTLKLRHDPFSTSVAEQELQTGGDIPLLYHYIIKSSYQKVTRLQAARNGFVFGLPGSGKTTLRFALLKQLRNRQPDALSITYELGSKYTEPVELDLHWKNIAYELAIDLFIYAVEHVGLSNKPVTEEQKSELTKQISLIWNPLKKIIPSIISILETETADVYNDISRLWTQLGRYSVRYIYPSPKVIQLLKECIPPNNKNNDLSDISGEQLLEKGVYAANVWGLKNLYVLIDGVDANSRDVSYMTELIAPLLENLARWQDRHLFFMFFLTTDMKPIVEDYKKFWQPLTNLPMLDNIEWNTDLLKKVLRQRLATAGSTPIIFEGSEFDVEEFLASMAHNSPSKLLELMHALIEAHILNGDTSGVFSRADLERLKHNWAKINQDTLLSKDAETMLDAVDSHNFIEVTELETLRDQVEDQAFLMSVITAPAGYGKTEILGREVIKWPNHTPMYISAKVFANDAETKIHKWLDEQIQKFEIDENKFYVNDIGSKLAALSEKANQEDKPLLLLIDDVLLPNDMPESFSRLLQCVNSLQSNISVVIAGRSPDLSRLWGFVIVSESITLTAFGSEKGRRQLEGLGVDAATIDRILELISPYEFGVPGINEKIAKKYCNDLPLNDAGLWEIARDVYGDDKFIETNKQYIQTLAMLDTFTFTTATENLPIDIDETRDLMSTLLNCHLLHRQRPSRYKIVDGWREFFSIPALISNEAE